MWDDISKAVHDYLTKDFEFKDKCGRYYIYIVPDDWEYPYVTSFSQEASSWRSLANKVQGEDIEEFPFWVHCDFQEGGPSKCREITDIIDSAFNYETFDVDNYNLLSCKRQTWMKPIKEPERDVWHQLITFNMRFEKED